MRNEMTVALIGAGGYGEIYLSALLREGTSRGARFVAAVDLNFTGPHATKLAAAGVPQFASMQDMYRKHRPDLVVIASPIHCHASQTILALEHGSHVLCEKPLAATVEQSIEMKRARDSAGRTVAIGYQWSFCPMIQALKKDIAGGLLGAPKQLRTLVRWPRDERYYTRNRWAGREFSAQGDPVFDSPVNNACSHYLHNMLFILGDRPDRSAEPHRVTAELYRANPIESYDTGAIRCTTSQGVQLQFITSHATSKSSGPDLAYEFENAAVHYLDQPGAELTAKFTDGTVKSYGTPSSSIDASKLWDTMDAIRTNTEPCCGIETALPHAEVVAAARASTHSIHLFPKNLIELVGLEGQRTTVVKGLFEDLQQCHQTGKLPSEAGYGWAVPGTTVTVSPALAPRLTTHIRRNIIAAAAKADTLPPLGFPVTG